MDQDPTTSQDPNTDIVGVNLFQMYVNIIPKFDSTATLLNDFITAYDELVTNYGTAVSEVQKQFVIRVIRNKLYRQAQIHILARLDLKTWSDIKSVLIKAFGDPRDLLTLQTELLHLNVDLRKESLTSLGHKIMKYQSLLTSKLSQSIEPEHVKNAVDRVYKRLSLDTYVRNLPKNFQQMVRTKISSLSEAISFVSKEEQFQMYNKVINNHTSFPNRQYDPNPYFTNQRQFSKNNSPMTNQPLYRQTFAQPYRQQMPINPLFFR